MGQGQKILCRILCGLGEAVSPLGAICVVNLYNDIDSRRLSVVVVYSICISVHEEINYLFTTLTWHIPRYLREI